MLQLFNCTPLKSHILVKDTKCFFDSYLKLDDRDSAAEQWFPSDTWSWPRLVSNDKGGFI